jgi:hypothetical protein
VPEARLVETEAGLRPQGDGWFVVNVADARALGADADEYTFPFEAAHRDFPHFGINITVLGPGRRAVEEETGSSEKAYAGWAPLEPGRHPWPPTKERA